jgi:hypothetical protein
VDFKVQWIDVTPNLVLDQQPVLLVERPLAHGDEPKGGVFNTAEVARVGAFWVPRKIQEEEIAWRVTRTGQHVRIPLDRYRTPQPIESVLFGNAVSLGMMAMESFRRQSNAPIEYVLLVLGHQVRNLGSENRGEEGYEAYLGLAIVTKE